MPETDAFEYLEKGTISMHLKQVTMRNFLAAGDEPVVIKLDRGPGITLIRGVNQDVSGKSSNGSGKSSIIESIMFGLKKCTLRKLNLPGIIHNNASNECMVEIDFDNARIERTIRRNAKLVKSSSRLFIDGVDRTTGSAQETEKMIDQIVGVNFETLSNILIFGQHNIISFLDAPEKDKREIIENLMNLREYNEYEEKAKDKLKETKSLLKVATEKYTLQSKHVDDQQKMLDTQQLLLEEYRKKLRSEIAALDQRISAVPDIAQIQEMWRLRHEYLAKKKQIDQDIVDNTNLRNQTQSDYNAAVQAKQKDAQNKQPLIDAVNTIRGKFTLLEERKRTLWQNMVNPLELEIRELTQQLQKEKDQTERELQNVKFAEDWDRQISTVDASIKAQNNRIANITKNGLNDNDVCPTCYGVVESKNAHKVIAAIQEEIKTLEKQRVNIETGRESDNARILTEKQKISDLGSEKVKSIDEKLSQKNTELQAAMESVKTQYFKAKESLDQMLVNAQSAVNDFETDLNSRHDAKINALHSKAGEIVDQIALLNKELAGLDVAEEPSVTLEEVGKLRLQLESDKNLRDEKLNLVDKNPYVDMIVTIGDGLKKLQDEADISAAEIRDLEGKLPYYQFWCEHMGKEGIKSFVIEHIIPTLNDQIDYWMQILYQGAISVKFDKYFNVSMINNASKNEMIFGQGSGGERRRIDIAVMLAFRQIMNLSTGKNPNVLFLDEIGENLDDDGIYRLYDAILEIAKTSRVFVITHNPTLLHLLQTADCITVSKQDGAMKLI